MHGSRGETLCTGQARPQTPRSSRECGDHLTTPYLHPGRGDASEASVRTTSAAPSSSSPFLTLHPTSSIPFNYFAGSTGLALPLPALGISECSPLLQGLPTYSPEPRSFLCCQHMTDRKNASSLLTLDSTIKIFSMFNECYMTGYVLSALQIRTHSLLPITL